jgi:hypothetical protein
VSNSALHYVKILLYCFSRFLDYIEYINIAWTFVGTMERKTSFYSILPSSVKSVYCEIFFTFLESLDINFLLVAVSLMTTFPGVLSYCIAQLIEGMTLAVNDGDLKSYSIQEILRDHQALHFSMRELNKRLGTAVLLFQFAQGAQQVAQTYCIFQLIKAVESLFTSVKCFSLTCWYVSYDLFISLILNCI